MKLQLPHTLAVRHAEGPWETDGGGLWEWSTEERWEGLRGSVPLVTTVISCSMKQWQGVGMPQLHMCVFPLLGTWMTAIGSGHEKISRNHCLKEMQQFNSSGRSQQPLGLARKALHHTDLSACPRFVPLLSNLVDLRTLRTNCPCNFASASTSAYRDTSSISFYSSSKFLVKAHLLESQPSSR